nr:cystinosin homolog [Onthophagus taurus]
MFGRRTNTVFQKILFAAAFILFVPRSAVCDITIEESDISLKLQDSVNISLTVRNLKESIRLQLLVQHDDILEVTPNIIDLEPSDEEVQYVKVHAIGAGHSEVTANVTDPNVNIEDVFIRVTVFKNSALDTFSIVIGWLYFVAWSVSFYPQIYINYKRKSVIGLNFDFLYLNIVGFMLYGTFNLGLYFIPEIKNEYFSRYPRGLNPVQVNDIVFAVHAALACLITICQCYLYERGEQKVSLTAKSILGVFALFLFISVILSAVDVIHWLDFLYYCSYVKLTITLIKYVPQAYMNYKRKSTVGWSIGNIFLDFTGGILSMLQMIINAHNYDDWVSIFGDPTKFGLGLFSVVFDIFFIIQHYVLYRHSNYEEK